MEYEQRITRFLQIPYKVKIQLANFSLRQESFRHQNCVGGVTYEGPHLPKALELIAQSMESCER